MAAWRGEIEAGFMAAWRGEVCEFLILTLMLRTRCNLKRGLWLHGGAKGCQATQKHRPLMPETCQLPKIIAKSKVLFQKEVK